MKYIKTFENIDTPQVGDYVLTKDRDDIGQIKFIPFGTLKVAYDNEHYFQLYTMKDIRASGKTPEEVKIKAMVNKYNI